MGIRLALVVGLLAWQSAVAHAATIVYDIGNTDNEGPGSLRQAILDANGSGIDALIRLDGVTGTIVLATSLDAVVGAVTITGPGADNLTILGATGGAVLTFGGPAVVTGVTIQGGSNLDGKGGGIRVLAGAELHLSDSVIKGNRAGQGGGIYTEGTLLIKKSTISNNTGEGAIYATAGTSLFDSTIADNTGTAIVFSPTMAGRALTIDRSTVSGNTAPDEGIGGLQLDAGTATLTTTTFANNTGGQGGDFWTVRGGVTLNLINVTAAGSSAPALLVDAPHTVTLTNTLLAGAGANCMGQPDSFGYNLASDTTCGFTLPTDKSNVDPLLSPLAANGGATKTCALTQGSPAVNAGGGIDVPETDQRGFPRVQFGAPDIGALEVTEPVITVQPLAKDVIVGETLTLSVAAQNQNSTTPLRFQWRKAGVPISGATSATYSKSAKLEDAGMYDVFVLNDGGIITSMAVMVTVTTRDTGGMAGEGSDSGGCCSATGGNAWSSGVLALVVAALLGQSRRSRRPRVANHRYAGRHAG